MFKRYVDNFITTPHRLWAWAELHPYESIAYGSALLVVALGAKLILAAAGGVAIVGGLYWLLWPR